MPGHWTCWFWTLVGAGFLGWGIKGMVLGPVMDEKRREVERLRSKVTMLTNQPPEIRTVEKRVEVPVERVVVKHVEVPVEKVVDRPVDNQEYLARIKALEGEVAMIAGLLPQIAQFQAVASQVGGRSIEERVVVPVDNPEHLARIKAVEDEIVVIAGFLAQIAQAQTASSQAGVKSIEDGVVVPANNPEHLARIKALEGEVAVIADLRSQMAELRDLLLQVGEKVAEKRPEVFAEQIVVQNGDVPVETISAPAGDLDQAGAVEQADERGEGKETPDDLKHIRGVGPALERFLHKRGVFWFSQVATWSQADIEKFEFLLPNFGGRIQRENWVRSAQVEYYKKYKQWLGDGEPPSESLDLSAQMAELPAMLSQARGKAVESEIETSTEKNGEMLVEKISEPAGDLNQAGAVGQTNEEQAVGESPDDLKQIYGVGPGLEQFLHKRGVFWFSQVATWSQADIEKFEFLLPNFEGRIQRENWVRSAQIEYYRKYKQWLGDDEPPSAISETHYA